MGFNSGFKGLNIYRYTVRTQLCYIIRYYTTYQLHVSAITWPSSGCTKLTKSDCIRYSDYVIQLPL